MYIARSAVPWHSSSGQLGLHFKHSNVFELAAECCCSAELQHNAATCSHRTSVCTCAPALNMISHETSHPFILLPADTCGVSLDVPFPERGREESSHISAENPQQKQRSSSCPVEPLLKAKITPALHKHLVSSLSD